MDFCRIGRCGKIPIAVIKTKSDGIKSHVHSFFQSIPFGETSANIWDYHGISEFLRMKNGGIIDLFTSKKQLKI